MQLLLIRHAIAEERDDFAASGKDDAERPLTSLGRRRMTKNARGLRRVAPGLELIVSSPYVRALETAQIVSVTMRVAPPITSESLVPGRHPKDFFDWFAAQSATGVIAAVGHEPDLSTLLQWALSKKVESHAAFKKGGAALVAFDGAARAGDGILTWLLTPSQLRAIAG